MNLLVFSEVWIGKERGKNSNNNKKKKKNDAQLSVIDQSLPDTGKLLIGVILTISDAGRANLMWYKSLSVISSFLLMLV